MSGLWRYVRMQLIPLSFSCESFLLNLNSQSNKLKFFRRLQGLLKLLAIDLRVAKYCIALLASEEIQNPPH